MSGSVDTLSLVYAVMLYGAAAIFVLGVGWRVVLYLRTPSPLRIPTMPAPLTRTGAALRVAREVVLFESAFKGNPWIWLFSAMFHLGFALEVLRHLRYFLYPVWLPVVWLQWPGLYGGWLLAVGLLGLLGRRLWVPRIRYLTSPSDILWIVLILAIALSGFGMTYVQHTDIVSLKEFALGLVYGHIEPLPKSPWLLVHLALVSVLLALFPFSKLIHGVAVFFSPTRYQADSARERRHVCPWGEQAPAPADRES